MELEHKVETFPIDQDLQGKVQKLVSEGWEVTPGIPAVAVYHLVRIKPVEAPPENKGMGAFGVLQLDDSKVMVIPPNKASQ